MGFFSLWKQLLVVALLKLRKHLSANQQFICRFCDAFYRGNKKYSFLVWAVTITGFSFVARLNL
jgi:hypothetical protein